MKIYHNPRCSKSRQTLKLIEDAGTDFEVVAYLKEPPTKDELSGIINKLDISPEQLIRKGEAIYKDNYKGKSFTNDEWIEILVNNPKLIERPIVVSGNKAVVGRPPENVKSLL